MNCTCGSQIVGSDRHSVWCDSSRSISIVAQEDMQEPHTRFLYVTVGPPSTIYEQLKDQLKNTWLMCMDFNGMCSIVFKNNSEIYFLSKDDLNKEHISNFDGAYVDKSLESLNISKHLKPLAPIKYVENSLVV